MALASFPGMNAGLNAASLILLMAGWRAIRGGNRALHKRLMLSALTASALFLAGYVAYHFFVRGFVRYRGSGAARAAYLGILISHSALAAAIVPFVAFAVYRALREDLEGHKRITRWLLPVWMYVAITGVVIYFMLYG